MLEEVGADAVMIGRAALGNPWMIHHTKHYLETGELIAEPTPREKIATAKLHLERLADLKGEFVASREFRQHAAYYLKKAFHGQLKSKRQSTRQRISKRLLIC